MNEQQDYWYKDSTWTQPYWSASPVGIGIEKRDQITTDNMVQYERYDQNKLQELMDVFSTDNIEDILKKISQDLIPDKSVKRVPLKFKKKDG